jgi:hypothetical protein
MYKVYTVARMNVSAKETDKGTALLDLNNGGLVAGSTGHWRGIRYRFGG